MAGERNNKGRFEKGNKAAVGRKPQNTNLPKKETRMTAQKRAAIMLENLLGKAEQVIDGALSPPREVVAIDPMTGEMERDSKGNLKTEWINPDPRVAMWLVDRLMPKDGTRLPEEMETDLSTMQGVVDTAQKCIQWVATRRLTIEEGEKMLSLLLRYAQMKAFDHIEELRELVKEFETQTSQGPGSLPEEMVPQWGRIGEKLRDVTPANKEPAE